MFLNLSLALLLGLTPVQGKEEEALRESVATALNSLGVFYYKNQQYQKAIQALEEAVQHQPHHRGARTNLGMVYYHQGKFEKVLQTLAPLLEDERPEQALLTAAAVSHFALGRYKEAASFYEKLAALMPNDRVLQLTLSVAHDLSGNASQAQEVLKKLPNDALTRAQYHVLKGDAHRSQTKVTEALNEYETALTISPDLPEVNYWRGVLYSDLHKYDQSAKAFEREIQINPANANAHYSLGAYFLSYGNEPARAKPLFEQTVRLNPDHVGGYIGLMKIDLSHARPDRALALAEQAQARGLEDQELSYLKARALNLLGKKDLAEAELKRFQELKARAK